MGRDPSPLAVRALAIGLALGLWWLAQASAVRAQTPDAGTGTGHVTPPGEHPPSTREATTESDDDDAETENPSAPAHGGDPRTALPDLSLSERALSAGTDAHEDPDGDGRGDGDEEEDEEDEEGDAADRDILPAPARPRTSDAELEAEEEGRRASEEPDGEPAIIDDDMELPPDAPDLPQLRLRAGAGVALPTASEYGIGLRLTQDFEWQPRDVAPFLVGIDGFEVVGSGGLLGGAHLRVGLHAWICEARPVRCQAAIALIGGAAFGLGNVSADIAGEIDLRLLVWDRLEAHVRGGFFMLAGVPFIDITGGLGVAF